MSRDRRKVVLPVAVVAGAVVVAVVLSAMRAAPEARPPDVPPLLVRVVEAEQRDVQLRVHTHGTVTPRAESDLVPEVSGRVVWTSPALVAGGFFDAEEPLLRIEARDYETRVARATATVAGLRSQARLARRNRDRSRELARDGLISRSDLDAAENAALVAEAALAEAEAALVQAEQDLARTELRAPYAGRVRSDEVDVGEFVERGRPVARLYAVDHAEVRLPLPDADLAHLDLPLDGRDVDAGPVVELRASFAGRTWRWTGRIVRTEAEIDPDSRMVHAVARIDDPYGAGASAQEPPLAVGMFVDAEIVGRTVPGAIVLPRAALRGEDRVWVAMPDGHLRERSVEVVRTERERVVVQRGIHAGEQICVSPVEAFVDGMRVRTASEST